MKRLLLPLAALVALHPAAAEKEVLKTRWEPGKLYKMESVMKSTTSMPGAATAQGSEMSQLFEVRVTAEPGTGNKLAEFKITGMKATMEMMGQTQTYDSADPAKSPPFLQQAFGSMLNKTFTLVFDKSDNYVETRGLEQLAATPLGATTGMDGKQLSDAFRKSFEMSLPKDPVGVGDTWTTEDKMDMQPMSMVVKATSKYDSVVDMQGRKHAKLVVEGTFTTPPDSASPLKIGEGSKFAGESFFDLQRRMITHSESRSDINMQMQGQTIPTKQTVTMKLLSMEDAK